jgi:hypothetical protein
MQALLGIWVAAFCAVAFAEGSWRFPTDEITQEQWQIYLEEVRALPGAEIREAANQILISVPSRLTIYVFTSPAHPAFPAVVIRQIVEVDGNTVLSRRGHYAGDKAAYDRWWHEFDELDRKTKEAVEK